MTNISSTPIPSSRKGMMGVMSLMDSPQYRHRPNAEPDQSINNLMNQYSVLVNSDLIENTYETSV